MEYNAFKEFLEKNELSLKQFSELTNISYSGCNKWKYSDIPSWVESWCKLYEENKKLKKIKELILSLNINN